MNDLFDKNDIADLFGATEEEIEAVISECEEAEKKTATKEDFDV
jgi:hypothetical protein